MTVNGMTTNSVTSFVTSAASAPLNAISANAKVRVVRKRPTTLRTTTSSHPDVRRISTVTSSANSTSNRSTSTDRIAASIDTRPVSRNASARIAVIATSSIYSRPGRGCAAARLAIIAAPSTGGCIGWISVAPGASRCRRNRIGESSSSPA